MSATTVRSPRRFIPPSISSGAPLDPNKRSPISRTDSGLP